MKLQLARAVQFQCAHSYRVKEWSQDKNLREFGPCFSPHGHGHSYRLECFVEGNLDPVTGMVINLRDLDLILKKTAALLDGKFLNRDLDHFKETIPTTEKIAEYLFKILQKELKEFSLALAKIRLFEMEDLWVEITP